MLLVLAAFAALYFTWQQLESKPRTIAYSDFVDQVRAGNVTAVTLEGQKAQGDLASVMQLNDGVFQPCDPSSEDGSGDTFTTTVPESAEEVLVRLLDAKQVQLTVK